MAAQPSNIFVQNRKEGNMSSGRSGPTISSANSDSESHSPDLEQFMNVSGESDCEGHNFLLDPSHKAQKSQAVVGAAYVCRCGKTFATPSTLKKHEKYHIPKGERPHPCQLCTERFVLPKDLSRHQQSQHNIGRSSWTCERCSKVFSRRDQLSRHYTDKHLFIDGTSHRSSISSISAHSSTSDALTTKKSYQPASANHTGANDRPIIPAPIASNLRRLPELPGTSGPLEPNATQDLQFQHSAQLTSNGYTPLILPAIWPRFRYKPLETSDSIRILSLHPGNSHQPLTFRLEEFQIGSGAEYDMPKYEALSYCWGTQVSSGYILIETDGLLYSVAVRSNLIRALECLRTRSFPTKLWVDAICINQADVAEKSQQVALMAKVYANATNVCVWLGEHEHDSEIALRFIARSLSDLGTFEVLTTSAAYSKEWAAFATLMNRPWFSRRWVIQELSLAKIATVHCGQDTVAWSDLETAVALFERATMALLQPGDHRPPRLADIQPLAATRLVQAKNSLFRKNDVDEIVEYKYNLSDLVTNLTLWETSDSRDMIYALLSLAKDTHDRIGTITYDTTSNQPRASMGAMQVLTTGLKKRSFESTQPLNASDSGRSLFTSTSTDPSTGQAHIVSGKNDVELTHRQGILATEALHALERNLNHARRNTKMIMPDYELSILDLCKRVVDVAMQCQDSPNNLDILCQPWAPMAPPSQLPSWVPTVKDDAFVVRAASFAAGGRTMARKNHDALVCSSSSGSSSYKACRGQRAVDWRFGSLDNESERFSLFVYGFTIDRIGDIEVFAQLGNIPIEWFRLAGWVPWDDMGQRIHDSHAPERLWRTLVADRGPDGTNAKVYYSKAFEYAIDNSTPDTGLETTHLATHKSPILVEFLTRVMAVVWNRRLFISTGGLLGLAPKSAKSSDVICILPGCSVPVVLRAHKSATETTYYEFMGECYLHSMMDGTAVDIQEKDSIPIQEFELR